MRPQPYTKNSKMLREAQGRTRWSFLRESISNWLFEAKWSALKTHIQATVHKLSKLYLGVYMHAVIISFKEAMNLM